MATFYVNLASVLNTTPERAAQLVADYNKGDLDFFQSYFNGLQSASLEESEEKNAESNVTLFVEADNIGSGAFGVVKRNRTQKFVYKSISDGMYPPDKRILYLKLIFKEALIQTLLQSDATYGKHICQIYKVYKNGDSCIFQMESLETTLDKFIDVEAYEKNTEPINSQVLKILIKILEIIKYFNTTYGFCHNDLSTGNIMLPKTGNVLSQVKLIDFGISSVKIGDVQIGKPLVSRLDPQYLILKLFTTLDINPNDFSKKLEKLLELPADTPIQAYIDNLQEGAVKKNKKKNNKNKGTQRRKRSSSMRKHE